MAETEVAAGPLAVLEAAAKKFREYEAHHRRERADLSDAIGLSATDSDRAVLRQKYRVRQERMQTNAAMAMACEKALADLQALIEGAGKRDEPRKVSEDDRRRVFEIGFNAGTARQRYLTAAELEVWPDGQAVPPPMTEAWAIVAAAIAQGGASGGA